MDHQRGSFDAGLSNLQLLPSGDQTFLYLLVIVQLLIPLFLQGLWDERLENPGRLKEEMAKAVREAYRSIKLPARDPLGYAEADAHLRELG